jgi:hypothetical protein
MTKVENKNGLNLKIENGKFIFTPCSWDEAEGDASGRIW